MVLKRDIVIVGKGSVSLDRIIAVARGRIRVELSAEREFIDRIERTQSMLAGALENGVPVYGVNTGYGKSCGKRISAKTAAESVMSPITFHGCGTGDPIGIEETRAAMLCRLISLSTGYSGVSRELLEQIESFLNRGITPVVPAEGSVGASGDLTPLSYIAAALAGQREVFYRGRRMLADKALAMAKLAPYRFQPKEPLAMLNGTSVMTGIACMAIDRARRILDAAIRATALTVHAFKGRVCHFHPVIGRAKPFAGQIYVADCLRRLLASGSDPSRFEERSPDALQDPYSIRCTPQIAGVLYDALAWIGPWVETEASSSNDNPIFDPESGAPLMSGNFYGGHIAFAMDALKSALAAIADLSDRQILLLVSPQSNRGLPADLVGAEGERFLLNHGFKAASITASALCAEALKATMPAASFSRSSESHNQDKVSMGTIAARDARRICELAERVVAIHLLTAAQGCDLRGHCEARPGIALTLKNIRAMAAGVAEDRRLDVDILKVADSIAHGECFRPPCPDPEESDDR